MTKSDTSLIKDRAYLLNNSAIAIKIRQIYAKDMVSAGQVRSAHDPSASRDGNTDDNTTWDGHLDHFGAISTTKSFQWLIWRLNRYFQLDFHGVSWSAASTGLGISTMVEEIRNNNTHLGGTTFILDWGISDFHEKQQYECGIPEMLEKAVVLTGYDKHIQATTCREYISQIWGDEGLEILDMLQRALSQNRSGGAADYNTYQAGDSTPQRGFAVIEFGAYSSILCQGIPHTLVAVAASLLEWLSASLRVPGDNQKYVYSIAQGHASYFYGRRFHTCHISNPRLEEIDFASGDPASLQDGGCWLGLFRHAVIAKGFPILLREPDVDGLELSMELMSALTGATYLVNFGSRTFIKGFSTMLAVTGVTDSTVLWHFLYKDKEKHISYGDSRLSDAKSSERPLALSNSCLQRSRHILGWSQKISSAIRKS